MFYKFSQRTRTVIKIFPNTGVYAQFLGSLPVTLMKNITMSVHVHGFPPAQLEVE